MIQAHQGNHEHSGEFDETVILGRPFFKYFQLFFDYEARTINMGPISLSLIRKETRREIFTPRALILILVLTLVSLALLAGVVMLYQRDKNRNGSVSTVKEAAAEVRNQSMQK